MIWGLCALWRTLVAGDHVIILKLAEIASWLNSPRLPMARPALPQRIGEWTLLENMDAMNLTPCKNMAVMIGLIEND